MIRKFCAVLAALVLLASCASTQGSLSALPPTANPATALASITYRDGTVENIGQAQLDALRPGASLLFQGDPPTAQLLEYLLSRKLMLYLARTTKTSVAPEDLEKVITNVTQGQLCSQAVPRASNEDNRAVFEECARQYKFADGASFRNFIAEELTVSKVATDQAPKDLIHAAHILTQNYEQAAAAYDRVIANPARFDAVADQVSIDPGTRGQGGLLPPFNQQGLTEAQPGQQQPQQFESTFVSKTWELRPEFERTGQAISQPFLVSTDVYSGYHIVKIVGLEASRNSANQFRQAVYDRARSAKSTDLNQPNTGAVPLVGAVQILTTLATPEPLPSEGAIPTPLPGQTAVPSEAPLPAATPDTERTTAPAAPASSAPPARTTTP